MARNKKMRSRVLDRKASSEIGTSLDNILQFPAQKNTQDEQESGEMDESATQKDEFLLKNLLDQEHAVEKTDINDTIFEDLLA